MVPTEKRTRARLGIIVLLALAQTGCPRKLTERVVERVETAVEKRVQVERKVPVGDLVMVAVVQSGEQTKAVLAMGGDAPYAAVVGVGDTVGQESAAVIAVSKTGTTVQLPADRSQLLLPMTHTLKGPASSAPQSGQTAPKAATPAPAGTIDAKCLSEQERWRVSVIKYVKAGYGVPVDILLPLSIATSPSSPKKLADALRKLGWAALPHIGQVVISRLEVRAGHVSLRGIAPDQGTLEGLLKRLKDAPPLLSSAQLVSSQPKDGALGFEITLVAPLVAASSIADGTHGPSTQPLPLDLKARLDQAAQSGHIAPNPALGGFEGEVKAVATQAGLTVQSVTRQPAVEGGYLGSVPFELVASGPGQGLIGFLAVVRSKGINHHPVVVDPMVVAKNQVRLTLHVPFVAGKGDSRSPAPPSLRLPSLNSSRWTGARAVPTNQLRDPFRR